eukprot:scaffold17390_cov71-Phaeocystis_antarctica.AAC.2
MTAAERPSSNAVRDRVGRGLRLRLRLRLRAGCACTPRRESRNPPYRGATTPTAPEWSAAGKWAALEADSSNTGGGGWGPSGPASSWERRAAQSRQERPEEALEPSWGTAKGTAKGAGTLSVLLCSGRHPVRRGRCRCRLRVQRRRRGRRGRCA